MATIDPTVDPLALLADETRRPASRQHLYRPLRS